MWYDSCPAAGLTMIIIITNLTKTFKFPKPNQTLTIAVVSDQKAWVVLKGNKHNYCILSFRLKDLFVEIH